MLVFGEIREDGICDDEYLLRRLWVATDACTNETPDLWTVTVQDSTAPLLSVPPNVQICCADSVDPANTETATAPDNCDPSPALAFSDSAPPSDLTVATCPQIITRTWEATDDCGNMTAPADQLIEQISCCGNSIVEGLEECDDGDNRATDRCLGNCTLNPNPGVPTVSEWGLIVMAFLALVLGTVLSGRRRASQA